MLPDTQGLIVQKYGGSSLATAERIRAAARRVSRTASSGRPVIVVVSAMGDTTDELIELAYQVAPRPDEREMDMLLSTGETVSATLLAMALHDMHQPAVSLTGAQAGIVTDLPGSGHIVVLSTNSVRNRALHTQCRIAPTDGRNIKVPLRAQ